jgi:hypothetical protein
MAKIQVIRAGESLPFTFSLDVDDPDQYICTITARQYPDDAATIDRVVASSIDPKTGKTIWTGFLTSTETSTLAVGLWILNANLDDATDVERSCIPVRFHVAPNWST